MRIPTSFLVSIFLISCPDLFAQVPQGMVLVPEGVFVMGATTNVGHEFGTTDELPQHNVYVGAFYMDTYEVTKELWDTVYLWASTNVYVFGNTGGGKTNHPACLMDWFDAVKWCNARSEREGLNPVYYTDVGLSAVYREGEVDPFPNWTANGYRLPTEAEWERAARGGIASHRFSWSDTDTIQQTRANYFASSSRPYDTNPTEGYHPDASDPLPRTLPVGSFPPNGFGIFDMTGNAREWCWDWFSGTYYATSPTTNPRGPTEGTHRIVRGGSWNNDAYQARCADRLAYIPNTDIWLLDFGFRCVRITQQATGTIFQIQTVPSTRVSFAPEMLSATSGSTHTIFITPNQNYEVRGVYVDNQYIGAGASVTISNIVKDHVIRAVMSSVRTDIATRVVYDGSAHGTILIRNSRCETNYYTVLSNTTQNIAFGEVPATTPFTLSARISTPLNDRYKDVFFSGHCDAQLEIRPDNRLAVYSDCAGTSLGKTDLDVLNDGWHQVAVVASGGVSRFYVDGISTNDMVSRVGSQPIRVAGRSPDGAFGLLDDIRIWSRALSDLELQLVAEEDYEYSDYGQELCIQFDETGAPDLSSNSRTTTMVGASQVLSETICYSSIVTQSFDNVVTSVITSLVARHTYSLSAFIDISANGLQDAWEPWGLIDYVPANVASNVTVYLSDPDSDDDGMPDWMELVAGTDTSNSNSVWNIMGMESLNGEANSAEFVLSWLSSTGRTYEIFRALDPASSYTQHASGVTATPPLNSYTVDTTEALSAVFSIGVKTNAP